MEDFDRLVKTTMENGAEEVPAGLWEAVQSRVPSAATATKGRVIPVWFWGATAGLAAAAVALAVVFSGHGVPENPVDIVAEETSSLADVQEETLPQETEMQYAEASTYVPSAVTSPAVFDVTPSAIEDESEIAESASEEPAQVEEPAETVDQAVEKADYNYTNHQPESEETGIESVSKTQSDPFEEMDRADRVRESNRTGVVLTVFGDAASNTNPKASGAAGPWKAGASVPTKTSITETGESNYLIPLSFGTGVKFVFTPRWSLGVGVNFTYLQRSYAGTYREFNEETGVEIMAESFSDIKNRQYYVGIPVNAYFSIISNRFIDFYAYAGGAVEKCVSNKHFMKSPTNDITYSGKTGGALFNAGAGLGCEFIIADQVGIYIDPSVRYYFKGNAPKSIRTQQPFMAGIEAGIRVRL